MIRPPTIAIGLLLTAASTLTFAQLPPDQPGTNPPSLPLNTHLDYRAWASTPPMGWNSWDSFGAGVSQDDLLANTDYLDKNLKSHGWNLVTIDIQWYEPRAHTDQYREGAALQTDENGRLLPAANRFPLTKDSRGFKPIADLVHAKGLKLGVHLMRGIPRQCVDKDNTPILGTNLHAADIADKVNTCRWNHDMYGVDMTKPGAQEYYDSVFQQLAAWDLDFVKVDDLAGHDAEIAAVRKAIDKTGRPMVFSVSPGGASSDFIASNANLWRISDDFWDSWPALYSQLARLQQVTPFRGPGHWPDADMIPFGNIRTWDPKSAATRFTPDEHYTLMTAWCIARSPLILGGNLPKNNDFERSLLTNDEVIAVNQASTNNHQLSRQENTIVWEADVPDSKDKYVALFNTNPPPAPRRPRGTPPATAPVVTAAATQPAAISVPLADLGLTGPVKVRDLWTHQDLPLATDQITAQVHSHGAVLYRLSPTP